LTEYIQQFTQALLRLLLTLLANDGLVSSELQC